MDKPTNDVERLRTGIRNALEDLATVPCCFWACDGPDAGFQHMKTCNVCSVIIELRELVADSPVFG
jgi:hypothetical protein